MQWTFENYRLDADNALLWKGEEQIVLRPKTFDVLRYLVEHAGELVRKETLLESVWQAFKNRARRLQRRIETGHGSKGVANLSKKPEDEITRIALEMIPGLLDKQEEAIVS